MSPADSTDNNFGVADKPYDHGVANKPKDNGVADKPRDEGVANKPSDVEAQDTLGMADKPNSSA